MRIKQLRDEDFTNYKKASMFIGTISCGGKCCIEAGIPFTICQNDELRRSPIIKMDNKTLIDRYLNNFITSSIVFGGLEPFEQFDELKDFIYDFRMNYKVLDDIIIYTGYKPEEIVNEITELEVFPNIIIKFGRYIPNRLSRYDDILGITLASDNQYAKKISKI